MLTSVFLLIFLLKF